MLWVYGHNFFLLLACLVRDCLYTLKSDIYIHRILTYKDGARTESVNHYFTVICENLPANSCLWQAVNSVFFQNLHPLMTSQQLHLHRVYILSHDLFLCLWIFPVPFLYHFPGVDHDLFSLLRSHFQHY